MKVITTGVLEEDYSRMINRHGELYPYAAVRATKVVRADDLIEWLERPGATLDRLKEEIRQQCEC